MARLARIVVPDMPHHVTQRGNRRGAIFFKNGDHEIYRNLLAEQARNAEVVVWAYCFMPNHVHLILVPKRIDGLVWQWGKRTGDTPISSTPGEAGRATCFRAGSVL